MMISRILYHNGYNIRIRTLWNNYGDSAMNTKYPNRYNVQWRRVYVNANQQSNSNCSKHCILRHIWKMLRFPYLLWGYDGQRRFIYDLRQKKTDSTLPNASQNVCRTTSCRKHLLNVLSSNTCLYLSKRKALHSFIYIWKFKRTKVLKEYDIALKYDTKIYIHNAKQRSILLHIW